ncbi:hypothetical protein HDU98_011992 [Podochytrium sp. JEL0797]|nr:hypothetical protein HDU98_011992 [Podochytrium sp. JEL0797]
MDSTTPRTRAVHRLPLVVLQRIALHGSGDANGELLRLAVVAKSWALPALGALYRCPRLEAFDSFERLLAVLPLKVPGSSLVHYASLVQELDLCGQAADNLFIGDLDVALRLCSDSLRILRLGSVFHMSNMIVQSIATHAKHLMQLELPGCPVSDAFVPLLAKSARSLLRLDAAFTNLTVGSLVPLVKHAGALLELDLSECREAEDGLDLVPVPDLQRPLKFLNLRNTQITDPLLRFTTLHCPFLEILILESCTKVTDASLAPLFTTCPRLRSLDVSFCDAVTDITVNAVARDAVGCLQELYLSSCDAITPGAVHRMVQRAVRGGLEVLVMDGCELVVGSFVKQFAAAGGDEVECSMEREGLVRLAAYVGEVGEEEESEEALAKRILSPPMSPVLHMHQMMSELKMEVRYEGTSGAARKAGEGAFVKDAMMKGVGASVVSAAAVVEVMDDKEAAEYKALQESAANSASAGQRRVSKTLRHRKSLLGLSARSTEDENVEEMQEAVKQERAEKIKEKRRSGGIGVGAFAPLSSSSSSGGSNRNSQQFASPSLSTLELHERFLAAASIRRPAAEGSSESSSVYTTPASSLASLAEEGNEAAGKAAFLAAAAAKGLKISAPGPNSENSISSPKVLRKRPSSILRADVAAFIPTSPTSDNSTMDEYAYAPPPTVTKSRVSVVGVPAGPPSSGSQQWNPPSGIAPSSMSTAPITPAAAQTITTPTGETGVLLFSGRASRLAMAREAAATPTPTTPVAVDGTEEPAVVIASGRRRTRSSIIPDTPAALAVHTPVAPPITSHQLPTWATTPVPASTAPTTWGTDPTAWNNPAQLTSSSSTWSGAPVPSSQFQDPWAPQQQQHPISSASGEPATSVLGPAPVINSLDPWAAAPASGAAGGWQSQVQKPGPMGLGAGGIPPRPAAVSARFGSLGGAGGGGMSGVMGTPPGLLAKPAGLGGLMGGGNSGAASAPVAVAADKAPTVEGSSGFVYTVANRGRLLLKLKIETKIGGEQMLAVHEYDDPQQLATEFVNYWELQAFRDPLVRLIAVRKTNVLRNRGGVGA